MNINKSILYSVILCLLFYSCTETPKQNVQQQINQNIDSKPSPQEIIADSTVELSLNGIRLNHPFSSTIAKAKKEKRIYDVKITPNKGALKIAYCSVDLYIDDSNVPEEVRVQVNSFEDTITSIEISTTSYDQYQKLYRLYKNKYNTKYAIAEKNEEPWGEHNVEKEYDESFEWKYKNQSVRITTFATERRENYVKDASKRAPQNRYGVRYSTTFDKFTIYYKDYNQKRKEVVYELLEKSKQAAAEARQDSIKRSQEKKKLEEKLEQQEI